MKKLYLFIGLLFTLSTVFAQDEAVYNQYHLNHVLVNPGSAGFDNLHKVHLNARAAWIGFPGQPTTYSLSYNGSLGKTIGLGAMIYQDNIASLSRLRFQFSPAFRFQFPNVKLGVGFSIDFESKRVPASVMSNSSYDAGDNLIELAASGENDLDAAIGFYTRIKEKTYIGLSLINFVSARLGNVTDTEEPTTPLSYYSFLAGHQFTVDGLSFQIEPSLLIRKARNAPYLVHFNVKADFLEERLTTGLSYHSGAGGAVGILLGTKINSFRIYYSYDVYFGQFQQFSSGSHEVTASFEFGGKNKDRAADYR